MYKSILFTTIKKELAFQALAICQGGSFARCLKCRLFNLFIVVIWVKFRTKKSTPLKKKQQIIATKHCLCWYSNLCITHYSGKLWAAESRILFIIYLYWLTQTISLPLLISHTPQGSSRPIKWSELVSSCSDLQIQW